MDPHPVLALLPQVRRLAHYFRASYGLPSSEADDLYQDACVGALQAVQRYQEGHGATLATWAERRIWGAMLDGLRKRHTGRHAQPITLIPLTPRREAMLRAAEAQTPYEQALALDALLDPLNARERHMVLAYYVEGLEMAPIGAQLGITQSAVSQMHKTALRRLRAHLSQEVA